jgi:transposase-like protein
VKSKKGTDLTFERQDNYKYLMFLKELRNYIKLKSSEQKGVVKVRVYGYRVHIFRNQRNSNINREKMKPYVIVYCCDHMSRKLIRNFEDSIARFCSNFSGIKVIKLQIIFHIRYLQ